MGTSYRMRIVLSLARATLIEAVRNRLIWVAAIVALAAFGLSQFLNQVAITESREIQSALLAALLRISSVFIAAAFVITSMVREWNDKVSELLLSLPTPRSAYFFGKFAGFSILALVLAPVSALPLLLLVSPSAIALWTLSLFCELLIVISVSLFCVLSLNQIVPAFAAVAAFYALSRSMTAILIVAGAPLHDPTFADRIAGHILGLLSLLLPGLERMTQTAWLTTSFDGWTELGTIVAQTLVYVVLICTASLFDLNRRNF